MSTITITKTLIRETDFNDYIAPNMRYAAGQPMGQNFVQSGLAMSKGTGQTVDITAGVIFVDGIRCNISAVADHAITSNKDTYVFAGYDGANSDFETHACSYSEIASGKTMLDQPTTPSGKELIGIVRADAAGNLTFVDLRALLAAWDMGSPVGV